MTPHARLEKRIREDPLFAAEGVDIEASRAALARIERYVARLERAFTREGNLTWRTLLLRTFFTVFPLRRYAYPLDFMRSFLRCEELRRMYVADPSQRNAEILVASWRRTARLFRVSAERYRRLHAWALRLEKEARDYTLQDIFGNRSTFAFIERSLAMLVRNGKALEEEARACAVKETSHHEHRTVSGANKRTSLLPGAEAEPRYLRLHGLEKEGGVMPFRYWDVVRSHGPFTFELDTFDGAPKTHTFIWYLLERAQEGVRCIWVASLDTFLFTKVWAPEKKDGTTGKVPFVFGGGVTRQEAPYWYEPTGHLYLTRDLSYIAEISARVDAVLRPELGAALLTQRSGMLDALWGAGMDDLRIYVRHTRRRARDGALGTYSLLYGLLMRTHPYLYFLAFNESVWRLDTPLDLRGIRAGESGESPYEAVPVVMGKLSEAELKIMMSAQRVREEREIAAGFGEA